MSGDEDFDHKAYREYEDQLYQEESLSGSVTPFYRDCFMTTFNFSCVKCMEVVCVHLGYPGFCVDF